MTSKRRAMTGPMGTPMPRQAAYVTLDGYAGKTKLFGTVDAKTHAQFRFTPDRDCYQFRAGVPKWVAARNVRFQYVNIEATAQKGGG